MILSNDLEKYDEPEGIIGVVRWVRVKWPGLTLIFPADEYRGKPQGPARRGHYALS